MVRWCAEADLILVVGDDEVEIDSTARVHPNARVGAGTIIGPYAVIGANVVVGERCRIGASAVIDGWTTIGDESEIYPFASIGLPPQDLKYRGEPTTLEIGKRNIFREFVTIHRGTAGGGGRTTIGDGNLFMGYVHIAHDCHVGSHTISARMRRSAGTCRLRISPTSAPGRPCTSSAASAATRLSAAIRWSPKMRCRMR